MRFDVISQDGAPGPETKELVWGAKVANISIGLL